MEEDKRREIVKEYSNKDITIVWKPGICIHATFCWRELLEVFDPEKRPWVNPAGASTERMIMQIDRCPSKALTYYYNSKKETVMEEESTKKEEILVEMAPDGPLMVTGNIPVKGKDGKIELKYGTTAFCRCGGTKNPPYCDGTHIVNHFKG